VSGINSEAAYVQPLQHPDEPSRDHRAVPRRNRYVGNLAPMPGVFPDYPAPVIRNSGGELEMTMMRWGMPPPPKVAGQSSVLVTAFTDLVTATN
jgi:putative SOS response-associated peptidase YedK